MIGSTNLRLTSQADIVGVVPYLLGFYPTDSLVCIVMDDKIVQVVARFDLPDPSQPLALAAPATHEAAMFAAYGSTAILVGYGSADRVEPAAIMVTAALGAASVEVRDVLRVTDGQYWCLCGDAHCRTNGVAYQPDAGLVAAEAVYLGMTALPDRAAVEQLITPVSAAEHDRMEAATSSALRRLTQTLTDEGFADDGGERPYPPPHVVDAGVAAVQEAYDTAAGGVTLSDEQVAWLTAVLVVADVRDHAWTTCDGSEPQRRLWMDVTRRAMPRLSAAPACLLGIAAYLAGDGTLASIAVDRSLRADPDYPLARLLRRALRAGFPPHRWRAATAGIATDT